MNADTFLLVHELREEHERALEGHFMRGSTVYSRAADRLEALEAANATREENEQALIVAIGYDPVKLSIRDHPEITYEYRTIDDRDGLIQRILDAGFTLTKGNAS